MKKLYLSLAAFAGALLVSLSSCGSGTAHDGHEHEHEHIHDAETEAHAHEAEEEHDHAHEAAEPHAHGEGEAHGDEIILTPEKAKAAGVVSSLQEMRDVISANVQPERFMPEEQEIWNNAYKNYLLTVKK